MGDRILVNLDFNVFSVDPGLVSGYAHLIITDNKVSFFKVGQCDHFELGNMLKREEMIQSDIKTVFICESYKQNCRMTQSPYSLESIGLVRYWAYVYEVEFVLVNPSQHKSLIKDDLIKRVGLWSPSKGGHQNDAIRVGLWYLIAKRKLLTQYLKKEVNT